MALFGLCTVDQLEGFKEWVMGLEVTCWKQVRTLGSPPQSCLGQCWMAFLGQGSEHPYTTGRME